jgi:hypothetical protein
VLEQLCAAFRSYGRWFVLRISVMCVAWGTFIVWMSQNEPLSPFGYFILLSLILIPYSFSMGFKLKSQFVPFRSRLIPRWNTAHLAVAAGVSLMFVVLLAGASSLVCFSEAEWNTVSVVGMLGTLWFEALLFFSFGYLFHPIFGLILPALGFAGTTIHRLFMVMTNGDHPAVLLLLIMLDAVGCMALLQRMLRAHEGMSEFQRSVLNPVEEQRRYWASKSSDRGIRYRLWSWTNQSLNTIPRRLSRSFPAQVRHFQLGIVMSQGALMASIVLIPTFWILGRFIGMHFIDNNFIFWVSFPISSTFVQMIVTQKNSLQWMFMLPLRRKEIVRRYLCAMFFSMFKMWLSIFVAVFVVQWIPFPGTIKEFPPLLPIYGSFAAMLPIFGILSLVVMRPAGNMAKRIGPPIVICVIFTIVVAAAIARTTGMFDPAPVFSIAALITGTGLIWYSYRTWLQADLG